MKKTILLFFVVIAGGMTALCFPEITGIIFGGAAVIPDFPQPQLSRSYIRPSEVPASRVTVPVKLSMSDLESLANRNLPRRYNGDVEYLEGAVNGKLTYTLMREEDARVTAENGKIKVSVPLKFHVRFAGNVLAAIVRIPFSTQTEGAVDLFITVNPSVRSDWSVKTETEVDFAWVESPQLNVAGIKIGLQRVTDRFLREAIRDNLYKVDDAVNEELKLRDMMQREWDNLSVPVKVADAAFLHFDPRSVAASSLDITPDDITLKARAETGISLSMGLGDAVPARKKLLPPLEQYVPGDGSFSLNVKALLNYDVLELEAMKALSGVEIDMGVTSVAVKSLRLMGSGKRLVAAFEINAGSSVGTIYAVGEPYFDEDERVLSIQDFNLDEGTRDGLIKTAAWLLRPALVNFLNEKMKWRLGSKIDELADEARDIVALRDLSDELELKGTLESAKFAGLRVTSQGIEIGLNLEGTAALTYTPSR